MNVIVCTDIKMGTMFNQRRQSRDKLLCQKVLSFVKDARLILKPYSSVLFEDLDANIMVDENHLKTAKNGDFCFVEGDALLPFEDKIESIILFNWNRDYPSDRKLDIDLPKVWETVYTEDFAGSSHEKITVQIYVRR